MRRVSFRPFSPHQEMPLWVNDTSFAQGKPLCVLSRVCVCLSVKNTTQVPHGPLSLSLCLTARRVPGPQLARGYSTFCHILSRNRFSPLSTTAAEILEFITHELKFAPQPKMRRVSYRCFSPPPKSPSWANGTPFAEGKAPCGLMHAALTARVDHARGSEGLLGAAADSCLRAGDTPGSPFHHPKRDSVTVTATDRAAEEPRPAHDPILWYVGQNSVLGQAAREPTTLAGRRPFPRRPIPSTADSL